MKQNIATTKKKMEAETEVLKQQIAVLEGAIQREDERAKELELRSKMFSFGEYKADEQEKMLQVGTLSMREMQQGGFLIGPQGIVKSSSVRQLFMNHSRLANGLFKLDKARNRSSRKRNEKRKIYRLIFSVKI